MKKRCRYVDSMNGVLGTRPAAIVYLPKWYEHRSALDVSDAIAFCAASAARTPWNPT